MKKRIVCVLLTLIMLVGMLPLSASAAGRSISENAITILKQLEGYSTACSGKGKVFGYGTICTTEKKHTTHTEKEADLALREALKDLDKAVNSFASKKGLSLSQNKHDALVLFSFENGTAWTTGTGDFQSAVAGGKIGTDFLNAICRWNTTKNDDNRRMIEANMYLNGVYSSNVPANFISVYYYPNYEAYELPVCETDEDWAEFYGALTAATNMQYYDVSNKPVPHLVPTMEYHTFTGWYTYSEYGLVKVSNLTTANDGDFLMAGWVLNNTVPSADIPAEHYELDAPYLMDKSQVASSKVYKYDAKKGFVEDTKKTVADYYFLDTSLRIDAECRDEAGQIWGRIEGSKRWIKVRGTGSAVSGDENIAYIDVTVTVTNSFVNMRVNANVASQQNGSFKKGDQLRIINTANGSGYLWGQVATSATDNTPIGWVALMYTNFDAVRDSEEASKPVNNGSVIAKAAVTYNGYVNLRSGAGTDNQIVGALAFGTEVDLYETKFVNGQEWGRCSTGWFCLNYAKVEKLKEDKGYASDVGFTSYVFDGTLTDDIWNIEVYKEPSESAERVYSMNRMATSRSVTITNLVEKEGFTWGKCSLGWIKVTDNETYAPVSVNLHTAKYLVSADTLTARQTPGTEGVREDVLVKNVEFNVNEKFQVLVIGDSVWGYATKVGENERVYGWVNLANKNVTRNGTPSLDLNGDAAAAPTQMARVINTNSVKVRVTGATYGKQVGTLAMGTTAAVLEESDGWYNLDIDVDGDPETGSWVSGQYLEIYKASAGTASSGTTGSGTAVGTAVETGMGIVANTYTGVNVRNGAGTGYAATGKLLAGSAVEILEVVDKGTAKWGRTAQGWVCMDYITMISNYPIAGTTTGTNNNTSGNTSVSSEPAIFTGTAAQDEVKVYKTTSESSDVVRTLYAGDPITMHELLAVTEDAKTSTKTDEEGTVTTTTKEKTTYWARINDGYIAAPALNINLDTVDEYTYTVTDIETQNVRTGAGTDQPKADFKLVKGDQVKVTQLKIVKNGMWGFIECDKGTGWASMLYMTKGAITVNTEPVTPAPAPTQPTVPPMGMGSNVGGFVTNSSGYRYTGKVINADAVNVRATASTAASITTQLKYNQSLVIYETTISENMAWGRCDAGWVYLYYVDLTPVVNGAVDARVVYNDNTIIYTDVNCSGVAGTYARMSVIDIYEIVGTMARTDKGWVSTNDLL